MQTKKYLTPSARSKTHMRRNILNTLEKGDDSDASWLNDVSPASPVTTTQTQEHTVCYEDLPTMPLSLLSSSLAMYTTEHEEEAVDDDKTIRLEKHEKKQCVQSLETLLADETISLITMFGSRRVCIELNIRVRPI